MHSVNDDVVVDGQWSEDINTLLLRDLRHLSRHQSVPTAHVQPVTLSDLLGLNGPLQRNKNMAQAQSQSQSQYCGKESGREKVKEKEALAIGLH